MVGVEESPSEEGRALEEEGVVAEEAGFQFLVRLEGEEVVAKALNLVVVEVGGLTLVVQPIWTAFRGLSLVCLGRHYNRLFCTCFP